MNPRSLLSLVSVTACLMLACGGKDEVDAGGTNCQKFCALAKTLNCANDSPEQCIASCDQRYESLVQAKPMCQAAFDTLAACLADGMSSDFECSASGQAQPKPQVCAIEESKAEACFLG